MDEKVTPAAKGPGVREVLEIMDQLIQEQKKTNALLERMNDRNADLCATMKKTASRSGRGRAK